MITEHNLEMIRGALKSGSTIEQIAKSFGLARNTFERQLLLIGYTFEREVRLVPVVRVGGEAGG